MFTVLHLVYRSSLALQHCGFRSERDEGEADTSHVSTTVVLCHVHLSCHGRTCFGEVLYNYEQAAFTATKLTVGNSELYWCRTEAVCYSVAGIRSIALQREVHTNHRASNTKH